jgi:predicted deacylase
MNTARTTKKRITVGTARATRGRRTTGRLALGSYPDGAIDSPVIIATGAKPGPTLWIQGCVHGPEVGGPVAMLRFLDGLDLKKVSGTIVAVMTANPTAFRTYSRNTPHDGENLNRVFPGSASGPHSRQTAHILTREALKTADAMLDLHSGGDRSIVPFYALYWNDGSPTATASARLARAAATPDIWSSTDTWLDGAMFTHLTRSGIPALIIECGGGGRVLEEYLDNYVAAMQGVAKAMGILPGREPRQRRYRTMDNALLVYNRTGGLFEPAVAAGDIVAKGQELGRIRDLFGKVVEVVKSPSGPAYIASMRRAYMPVYSGDQIAETIDIIENR